MLEHLRGALTAIISPLARFLLRLGVTPDAVTLTGTIGTCAAALWLAPQGRLIAAALIVTVFALCDLLDGTMARMSGRTTRFGAFFDATLDRISDACVFGAVALYFAGPGDMMLGQAAALYCLIAGTTVSYARAKAEALGFTARVGMMERADRLVVLGIAGIAADLLERPAVLAWGLVFLGLLTTVTVVQRVLAVRRQDLALESDHG